MQADSERPTKYEPYGPHEAEQVQNHKWLKSTVHLALMPLEGLSYLLSKGNLASSIPFGLGLVMLVLFRYRVKRKVAIES
jgi:hypothetical protein